MATTRPARTDMADSNKRPRSPEKSERDYDSTKRRRKEEDVRDEDDRSSARHSRSDGHRNGERQGRDRRERDDHEGGRDRNKRGGDARHDRDKRVDNDRQHDTRRDRDRGRDNRNGERPERDSRPSTKPSPSSTTNLSSRQKEAAVNGDAMDVEHGSLDPEDPVAAQMKKLMGFSNFRSTKNTKVPGNDKNYAVRKEKKTEYRQYMNRVGGFNRPLSPSR